MSDRYEYTYCPCGCRTRSMTKVNEANETSREAYNTTLTGANDEYIIKDSGNRQEFSGGMQRDVEDDKLDYTNLFEFFEPMGTRYVAHMTKGRSKYKDVDGKPNWMLAEGDEEYARYRRSAARHFKQWLRGDTDEDHAAAVLFNINGAEYVKGNE